MELAATDRQYQLSALLRSAGLGAVLSGASGLVKTSGKVEGENLIPQSMQYSWTGENSINFARLAYADGAPVEYETNYKSERPQKAVVPIKWMLVSAHATICSLSRCPEKGDAFCRTPVSGWRCPARLNSWRRHGGRVGRSSGCLSRWEPTLGIRKTYERRRSAPST